MPITKLEQNHKNWDGMESVDDGRVKITEQIVQILDFKASKIYIYFYSSD